MAFAPSIRLREAEATVRAGREALRNVEQNVLVDAVTAYMNVVRDQAIVRLNENNVNVLSRELRATLDRFNVGEVTRTDVAQARSRRSVAISSLELARANLKASRGEYQRIIGHPPGRLREPAGAAKTRSEITDISDRYRTQGTSDDHFGPLS